MEMRPGKQEGLTPSVFRFGLIGMFGISEPGRDSSPLTGLTTIPAHCSLNNTFCHFAQEIVLKGLKIRRAAMAAEKGGDCRSHLLFPVF